jgi:hypothetical protein
MTTRAAPLAVLAQLSTARLATARFIAGHRRVTVVALPPVPIIERHIGAVRAVGLEHLPHDHEKIVQPPFGESGSHWLGPPTSTKLTRRDMRMGNVRIAFRGVWF